MIETIRTETLDCTLARMARLRPLQEALARQDEMARELVL